MGEEERSARESVAFCLSLFMTNEMCGVCGRCPRNADKCCISQNADGGVEHMYVFRTSNSTVNYIFFLLLLLTPLAFSLAGCVSDVCL
jgi:hypothetical protein